MITIAPELKALPHHPLGTLLELQGDLKDLTDRNAAKLRRSIAKHGLFVPFFVWPAPDGNTYILDGHQRAKLMKADGHGALPVPCVLVHADTLQEAKEKLLVISSQYGKITQDGYDEFAFDLPDVGELVHFDALSFEFGQDEDEEPEQGDAEPQTDRAAELQELWGTQRGQLWAIGDHKLLCGDSTVRADVERVMGGERADIEIHDPPYGMRLDTDWSGAKSSLEFAAEKPLFGGKQYDPVIGDDSDFDPSFLFERKLPGEMFLFGADYYAERIPNRNDGSWIMWDKRLDDSADRMYGSCFELCWSMKRHKRDIARVKWAGVFGAEKEPERKRYHPTQKPVALYDWLLSRYSKQGDISGDFYAGVGSHLVACQNLSRRGRAIEISPAYCAVILQRMADAFPGIDIYQL